VLAASKANAISDRLQSAASREILGGCVSRLASRALVVLRLPRGAPPPGADDIRAAIRADRDRLALPADAAAGFQIAGPYAIKVGGASLDEYVAWET
jgi:hypothetical protein